MWLVTVILTIFINNKKYVIYKMTTATIYCYNFVYYVVVIIVVLFSNINLIYVSNHFEQYGRPSWW